MRACVYLQRKLHIRRRGVSYIMGIPQAVGAAGEVTAC